jgi:hypothetical protein
MKQPAAILILPVKLGIKRITEYSETNGANYYEEKQIIDWIEIKINFVFGLNTINEALL